MPTDHRNIYIILHLKFKVKRVNVKVILNIKIIKKLRKTIDKSQKVWYSIVKEKEIRN